MLIIKTGIKSRAVTHGPIKYYLYFGTHFNVYIYSILSVVDLLIFLINYTVDITINRSTHPVICCLQSACNIPNSFACGDLKTSPSRATSSRQK